MPNYVKYTCKKCGRVEYYRYGSGGYPSVSANTCKKSRDGYHVWDSGVNTDTVPAYRKR